MHTNLINLCEIMFSLIVLVVGIIFLFLSVSEKKITFKDILLVVIVVFSVLGLTVPAIRVNFSSFAY